MKRKIYKDLETSKIFKRTGEFRKPIAGEWFLFHDEAYFTKLDFEYSKFYILQEVGNRRFHERRVK